MLVSMKACTGWVATWGLCSVAVLITALTPASYANTQGRAGIVTAAACAAVLGSASTLVQ